MDIELKKRYIAALRSNDYKQCFNRARMRNEEGSDSFCAMGVLFDIVEPDLWEWIDKPIFGSPRYIHDRGHSLFFDKWKFISPSEKIKIIEMSDLEKKTFVEIADYIEENF